MIFRVWKKIVSFFDWFFNDKHDIILDKSSTWSVRENMGCEDEDIPPRSVQRAEAINKMIQDTIASLGGPGTSQFEIEASFEYIESDYLGDGEFCPIVKVIKR